MLGITFVLGYVNAFWDNALPASGYRHCRGRSVRSYQDSGSHSVFHWTSAAFADRPRSFSPNVTKMVMVFVYRTWVRMCSVARFYSTPIDDKLAQKPENKRIDKEGQNRIDLLQKKIRAIMYAGVIQW